MYGLVNNFFDSDIHKAYARKKLSESNAPVVAASLSDVVNIRTIDRNDDRKLAHDSPSCFKRHDKFSGQIGETINIFLAIYMEAVNDYDLNQSQKPSYFRKLFNGGARQFFRTCVLLVFTSFVETCTKM